MLQSIRSSMQGVYLMNHGSRILEQHVHVTRLTPDGDAKWQIVPNSRRQFDGYFFMILGYDVAPVQTHVWPDPSIVPLALGPFPHVHLCIVVTEISTMDSDRVGVVGGVP